MASWLPPALQRLLGKEDPVNDRERSDNLFDPTETWKTCVFQKTNVPPSVEKPQAGVHSQGLKDVQTTQVPKTEDASSSPFPSLEKPDPQKLISPYTGKECQSSSSAQINTHVTVAPSLSENAKGPTIPSGSLSSPAVTRPGPQRLILLDMGKNHQSHSADQTNTSVVPLKTNNIKGPSVSLVASTPSCLIPGPDTEKSIHIDLGNKHQSCSSAQTNVEGSSLPLSSPSPSSPPVVPKADTKKKVTTLKFKCNKKPSSSSSGLGTSKISVKGSKHVRKQKSSILSPHKVPNIDPASPSSRAESSGSAPVLKPKATLPVSKIPDKLKRELEDGKVTSTPSCLIPGPDTEKLIHIDLGNKHQSISSAQTNVEGSSLPLSSPSPSSPPIVPKADTKKKKVTTLKFKCNKKPSSSSSGLGTSKISVKGSKHVRKQKMSIMSPHKVPNTDLASPSSRAESSGSAPVLKPKATLPVSKIPDKLKRELEDGKVPEVLLNPLSQSNYCDYFAALLYAEDYYCRKWSKCLLHAVTLDVREGSTQYKNKKGNNVQNSRKDKGIYVVFEMDSDPERRPYLLSRDTVHLKPLDKKVKPFEGTISHVVKKSIVYAEFGDDFFSQHTSTCKYDVSFSFNRIWMKRCHLSIRAATDTCFHNFLFPDISQRILDVDDDEEPLPFFEHNLNAKEKAAVYHILSLWCPPPFLLIGPLSLNVKNKLSTTGRVIREAVLQIHRANPESRILLASPRNTTSDVLMESLTHEIPDVEMFRVNTTFGCVEEVPDNVLRKFRIIFTTFMSSFRLYSNGITSGHFSHVFLVDASSAIEPEVLVTLVNLVDDMTAVVVTGSLKDCPNQIRSDISQKQGLRKSYIQRLFESTLYSGGDPLFVSHI